MSRLDELRRLNDLKVITIPELLEHFKHMEHEIYNNKVRQYVDEVIFIHKRYLFVSKIGANVYTQCSNCGHREVIDKVPNQNSDHTCDNCYANLKVKNTKFKNHKEETYYEFVHFEKSSLSNDILVAYQFGAKRIITGNLDEVSSLKINDKLSVEAYYYFDLESKNRMIENRYSMYNTDKDKFKYARICKSIYQASSSKAYYWGISMESLHEAIRGSGFKYSEYELFLSRDIIKYLDFYSNNPQIEYLLKSGYENLVYEKFDYKPSFKSVNWRGKTLEKMLRMNKREMVLFKSLNDCSFQMLTIFHKIKSKGIANEEELKAAKQLNTCSRTMSELKEVIDVDKPSRILKYLEKQIKNYPNEYKYLRSAYLDFYDLIKDMQTLDIKISKKTLYYKNLHRHHMNLSNQIIREKNEIKDKQFRKRIELLDNYRFENTDFIIMPALSSKQLIEEGKALGHCVGGYADRHANGQTNIFFLRSKERVDEPYFTLEIDKTFKKIVQCYGKAHSTSSSNKAVETFLNEYEANILTGKRRVQNETCAN